MVVFPVPGPPVTITSGSVKADRIAFSCSSLNSMLDSFLTLLNCLTISSSLNFELLLPLHLFPVNKDEISVANSSSSLYKLYLIIFKAGFSLKNSF